MERQPFTPSTRRRRERKITWRMRMMHAPAVVFVCAVALAFGWFTATQWPSPLERCLDRYAHARTAADTARVDDRWLGGKNPLNGYTCGLLRHDGTLDRHRQAMQRRRAAAGAPRGALIQK